MHMSDGTAIFLPSNGEANGTPCANGNGNGQLHAAPLDRYLPFPVDVLAEPLAGLVSAGAAAIGCDPSYIALPLLTAAASAIGNTRRLRLKNGWSAPAVLWCAIVGESGTMKSPAQELAIRPVWERQRKIWRQSQEARADYEERRKVWRNLPREQRGDEPEPPAACEHPLCSDATLEALADRLNATPRGILVAIDELRGWFSSFDKYRSRGGGDIGQWLSVHRAGTLKIDRKTGEQRTIIIPRAAISICGGIQPAVLRDVLSPDYFASGLAARLLLAMPPRRPRQWTEADVDGATEAQIGALFESLYDLRQDPGPDGHEPRMLDLSPGAKDAWIEFYNQHAAEEMDLFGDLASAFAKLEDYCARFALIDHCVRATMGAAGEQVDEQSVGVGVTLARWFGREATRVYAMLSEGEDDRRRRELIQWIEGRGGSTTIRELYVNVRRYRRDPDRAEADLDSLAVAGIGKWQAVSPVSTGSTAGRPTRRFVLFPAS